MDRLINAYSTTGNRGQHLDVEVFEDRTGRVYRVLTDQDGEETIEEGE